jgi:hypothetical protein
MEQQSAVTTLRGAASGIRRRAGLIALAAVGAVALLGPASAHALTLSNLQAEPAAPPNGTTEAGKNTNFEINMAFDAEDVENLRIGLPPGLVGNPTATVQCTADQLNANACPAESQVGATTVNATVTVIAVPVTLDIQGKLFNLVPQPGEPARFGIVLTPLSVDPLPPILPPVILQSGVELRQSDLGLDTVIEDIPNATQGLPTHINSMHVTLFGNPPGGTKPFIRNPTSCGTATTNFTADAHGSDTEATGSASFTPTACDQVPFSPTFTALIGSPGHTAINTKPPVTTSIQQDFDEAGLKRAHVLLPTNIGSDSNVLTVTCPPADFQAGACAPNTVLGSALAGSPLLTEPLTGPVIAVGNPSGLPRIGLDLTGPLSMKLMGDFVVSPSAGLVFNGLPDIPIADFSLTFDQDRLVINLTDLCDGAPRTFTTAFDGHNGATAGGPVNAAIDGCTAFGPGKGSAKGKKCKKKRKKGKGKAAAAKKKKKKCKRKKRKKKK